MGKKILIIVFAVLFIIQVSCGSDTTQKEKNDKPTRNINNELVADRGSLTDTGEPIEKDQECKTNKQLEYKPGKLSTDPSGYKKAIDLKINKNYKLTTDDYSINQSDFSKEMQKLAVDWQVKTGFGHNMIFKLDNDKILSVYTETLRGGSMTSLIMIDSMSGDVIWSSECRNRNGCDDYDVFYFVYFNNRIVFSTYSQSPSTLWCINASNGEFLWQIKEDFYSLNLYLIEKGNCFFYFYNDMIIKRDFNGNLVQISDIKEIIKGTLGKENEVTIKYNPFLTNEIMTNDYAKKSYTFNEQFYLCIQVKNTKLEQMQNMFCLFESRDLSLKSIFPVDEFDDSTDVYSNNNYIAFKKSSQLKLYSLSSGKEIDINNLSNNFSYSSRINLLDDSIFISDYNYVEQYDIKSKRMILNLPLSDLLYVKNDRMIYIDRRKTKESSNNTVEETVCCIDIKTNALLWETKFPGKLYEEHLFSDDLFLDCWYICKSSGIIVGININTGSLWFTNDIFTNRSKNDSSVCLGTTGDYRIENYFLTTHGIFLQTSYGYTNLIIKLVPNDTPNKLLLSTPIVCLASGNAALTIRNTTNEEIDFSIIQAQDDGYSSNVFEIKINGNDSKINPQSETVVNFVLPKKPEFPSYHILTIKSGEFKKMIYISTGAIQWGDV